MTEKQAQDVKLVVFACEAGMGSSLIGANQLKKRVKDAGLDVKVIHSPVNQIPRERGRRRRPRGPGGARPDGRPAGGRAHVPQLPEQPGQRPARPAPLRPGEPIVDEAART